MRSPICKHFGGFSLHFLSTSYVDDDKKFVFNCISDDYKGGKLQNVSFFLPFFHSLLPFSGPYAAGAVGNPKNVKNIVKQIVLSRFICLVQTKIVPLQKFCHHLHKRLTKMALGGVFVEGENYCM
jgi:hypothetical protein